MSGSRVKGVAPGFLLIPAREYEWELVNRVEIEVPREGTISSLLTPLEIEQGIKFPGDDEFRIWDEEDKFLLLWSLVQVLFASSAYPQLRDNECFNVVALEIKDDTIKVYGEIIRYVDENDG